MMVNRAGDGPDVTLPVLVRVVGVLAARRHPCRVQSGADITKRFRLQQLLKYPNSWKNPRGKTFFEFEILF